MADDDLPYQLAPQIEQLRQERVNAEAYGQTERLAAVDKQLAELGVKAKAAEKRKAAAEEKAELEDDKAEARTASPQGRSARPQQKA